MRSRIAAGLLAMLLAGCEATPTATPAPTSSREVPTGGTVCRVTLRSATTSPDPGPNAFGYQISNDSRTLWMGGLWEDGVIPAEEPYLRPDGAVGMKFGWWREVSGKLTITGRQLDGAAPPLRAEVPDGYGDRGFQASGVIFPTEGCWEVIGELAGNTLTFVTLVRKLTP